MVDVVDVSVWVPELATRVAGASNVVLRQELAGAMREFFVSSGSWLADTVAQDIVAQQDVYTLLQPVEGTILYTYGVQIDNESVRFNGTDASGVIKLRQAPSVAKVGALFATVATRPTAYDVVPINTETYDFDTILDGAMGRLFNMPDKPWSNSVNAQYHLKRFRIGVGRARVRTRGLFTNQDEGFRFPAWA